MLAPMATDPNDLTRLLGAWRAGDASALDQLVPLVYRELHRLARSAMRGERPGHTLQTTALVHEAFIGLSDAKVDWVDRAHFYAIAARQMRRILVNHGEAYRAAKRGGGAAHLPLDEALEVAGGDRAEIGELDDALQRLEVIDARKAQTLELHYFGGLTYDEIGAVLGVSASTVDTELRFGKAWLRAQLSAPG